MSDNLNERAAKAMGWNSDETGIRWLDTNGNYTGFGRIVSGIRMPNDLSPATDYNHARLLCDRVVEMGLEYELCERLIDIAEPDALAYTLATVAAVCRLTAAQLTEACCEVLEEHERKERDE